MANNSLEVAETIRKQLGGALAMLGARDLMGDGNALQFGIRGCKRGNKLRIALERDDTYTIALYNINARRLVCDEVDCRELVYADQLHTVIKEMTGLDTRL